MLTLRYVILIFLIFSSCLEMDGGGLSENGLSEEEALEESADGTSNSGTSDSGTTELSDEAMGIPVPIAKATNPADATLVEIEIEDDTPILKGNEGTVDAEADVLVCNVDDPSACVTVTAEEDGSFSADLFEYIVSETEPNIFSIQTTSGEEGSTPVFISHKPGSSLYSTIITNFESDIVEGAPFVFNDLTGEITFTIEIEEDGVQFLATTLIEGGGAKLISGLAPDSTEFNDQIYGLELPFLLYRDQTNGIHRFDTETATENVFLASEHIASREFILCRNDSTIITLDTLETSDISKNNGAFLKIKMDESGGVENKAILMKKDNMKPIAAACWNDFTKAVVFTKESENYKAYLLDLVDNTKNLTPKLLFKLPFEIDNPVMLPDDSGFVLKEMTKSGYDQIALYNLDSRERIFLTREDTDHVSPTVSSDGRFLVYQRIDFDGVGSQLYVNTFDPMENIPLTIGHPHYLPRFSRTENILTFRYGLPARDQVGILNFDLIFPPDE